MKRKLNITFSDIQHDVLPMSSSVTSKSRSPSLLHQAISKKIIDEHVSVEDSSHYSDSSDSLLHSTNSSTSSNQTNDSSSQFSSTQSVQSSSEDSESNFDEMSSSVPSISSTPHFSKQQIVNDRVDLRQTVHNMVTSSNHPGNSATQPPTSYISYSIQQKLLTPSSTSAYSHRSPSIKSQYSTQVEHTFVKYNENTDRHERKKDYQHRLSKEIHDNKIKKQNSWFQK